MLTGPGFRAGGPWDCKGVQGFASVVLNSRCFRAKVYGFRV